MIKTIFLTIFTTIMAAVATGDDDVDPFVRITFMCRAPVSNNFYDIDVPKDNYIFRIRHEGGDDNYTVCLSKSNNCLLSLQINVGESKYIHTSEKIVGVKVKILGIAGEDDGGDISNGYRGTASANNGQLCTLPSTSSPTKSPSSSPTENCGMAKVSVHCDNHLVFTRMEGDGNVVQSETSSDWSIPFQTHFYLQADTQLHFQCEDKGVIGGFIAAIEYGNKIYYTDETSIGNIFHLMTNIGDDGQPVDTSGFNYYNWRNRRLPWGSVLINNGADAYLPDEARWVWDDIPSVDNTMTYKVNGVDLYNECHGITE